MGHWIEPRGPVRAWAYLWSPSSDCVHGGLHIPVVAQQKHYNVRVAPTGGDTQQFLFRSTGPASSISYKMIPLTQLLLSVGIGTLSSNASRFGSGSAFRTESGEDAHECFPFPCVGIVLLRVAGAGECTAMSSKQCIGAWTGRSLHFVISRSPREGELFGRGDGSCTFQCALAHCPTECI